MWLQFIWFTIGFAAGLFCNFIIDYFYDNAQENLGDLKRYIQNFNGFYKLNSWFQTWITSPTTGRSIASGQHQNSRGHISGSSKGQSKSAKRRQGFTSPVEKIASSKASHPTPNLAFYQNEIPAKPNRERIEEILLNWNGNYKILQENSTYIQWLFPNRTPGTNTEAHVLTDKEAMMIQDYPELRDRVKRAFEMMLNFYGMKLTRDYQIQLAENSRERLKQLNQKDNKHFWYITRILLALKELGQSNLMLPFMTCLAKLIYQERKLNHAKYSFEKFWIDTLDAVDKMKIMSYNTPKLNGNSQLRNTANHNETLL